MVHRYFTTFFGACKSYLLLHLEVYLSRSGDFFVVFTRCCMLFFFFVPNVDMWLILFFSVMR